MSAGGNPISTRMKVKHTPQLISRRHLADRWSYSVETIKRQEKAGKLPSIRIGGRVRYRLSDIERLEQEGESK